MKMREQKTKQPQQGLRGRKQSRIATRRFRQQ